MNYNFIIEILQCEILQTYNSTNFLVLYVSVVLLDFGTELIKNPIWDMF